jgi:hypothetical protein
MTTKHLWFSTGILANDRIVGAHKSRLECLTNAIDALGKLRNEYGFSIDQLPEDINKARYALWTAYHAEMARKPALMPESDRRNVGQMVRDEWETENHERAQQY